MNKSLYTPGKNNVIANKLFLKNKRKYDYQQLCYVYGKNKKEVKPNKLLHYCYTII